MASSTAAAAVEVTEVAPPEERPTGGASFGFSQLSEGWEREEFVPRGSATGGGGGGENFGEKALALGGRLQPASTELEAQIDSLRARMPERSTDSLREMVRQRE